jgi:hypothetical protein
VRISGGRSLAFGAWLALVLAACGGTAQDLGRAERHYRRAEFPKALALLRLVGDELDQLPEDQRARYFYLRGMSDYRIAASLGEGELRTSFRAHARQHLVDARGALRAAPNALGPDEQGVLYRTLLELSTKKENADLPE